MKFTLIEAGGVEKVKQEFKFLPETLHVEDWMYSKGENRVGDDLDYFWDGFGDLVRGEDGKVYMAQFWGGHSGEYGIWCEVEVKKDLHAILQEKEQLLKEYQERVPENQRTWMNCNWRPASGLQGVIDTIKALLPYEKELSEIIGENEILNIGETICRAGNYIEIVSRSQNGAYNYKYFQIENEKLTMAYDFGNCETAFYEKVVSPRKYVLVDGVWRDEEIFGEVER